jgi:hypothetical protein
MRTFFWTFAAILALAWIITMKNNTDHHTRTAPATAHYQTVPVGRG